MDRSADAARRLNRRRRPGEEGHFRPRGWLDRLFQIGIALKGLDGVGEIIGGLLLLVVTPSQIRGVVDLLTQGELSEDPQDFVATHLLHTAGDLTGSAVLFGAIYLLVHGVVKVVLVVALLRNRMWAYPWMIGVLVAFIVYQGYRIALQPSAGLIGLTVFDVAVVALTIREWRVQRALGTADDTAPAASEAPSAR